MGERKKKERGQLREVIVPLPLDSALNRLTNRAGNHHATITLREHKIDVIELDLGIGYFLRYTGRYRRNPNRPNQYWKTRLRLKAIDARTTQITYAVIHLQGEGIVLIMLSTSITLVLVILFLVNFINSTNLPFIGVFTALSIYTWLVMWVRLRVLKRLLHNLDKPLGEY